MESRTIIKPLVLACSVALAACSGDDAPAPASTTTISGLAEAPNGVVAQFEHNKPLLLAATDLLFPSAHADIIGLQPVGGRNGKDADIPADAGQVTGRGNRHRGHRTLVGYDDLRIRPRFLQPAGPVDDVLGER